MGSRPHPRKTVARNFMANHGAEKFDYLIKAFKAGTSGEEIGREIGVSRERVRQWKSMFGTTITLYEVHPEICTLLTEK